MQISYRLANLYVTLSTAGFAIEWDITTELRKLVRLKCFKQEGDVFFPSYKDKPMPVDEKKLVPPREPIPFKPLKTFPRTVSPRGQTIEKSC